jgi:hypothetical protein
MPTPFVFISYSHVDKDFAIEFGRRLKQAGITHFRDDEMIKWGDDIPAKVHEAIERATHLVVLISPGSEQSQWVAYEMGYARGRKIQLIPYILHPSMKLPHFIASKRYLENRQDEARFITSLRRSLKPRRRQRGDDSVALERNRLIAQAMQKLLNSNAQVRADGVAVLVKYEAKEELVEALVHAKTGVRSSAAQGCGRLRIPQALPYLIAGMYNAGAQSRPVISGVEAVLERYGDEALVGLLEALDDRPLEWSEQRRWETAIFITVSKTTAPRIIERSEKFPWILRPLLRSQVKVDNSLLLPALEKAVHKPTGDIADSECFYLIEAACESRVKIDPMVRAAITRWVLAYLNQGGNRYWIKEIVQSAMTSGALSEQQVRDLYDRTADTKVRDNLRQILRMHVV